MKKAMIALATWFTVLFSVNVYAAAPQQVIAVGSAVGIDVKCSGLLIVGFAEESPARQSGLHRGDLIIQVDGQPISDAATFREMLQDKTQVTLTALRQQRQQSFLVRLMEENGTEMIGANVKSEMAGIGTITYYDPITSVFGALGHGITDGSSPKLFPVQEGFICKATVLSVDRGRRGDPGMLQGAFDSGQQLGVVTKNTSYGIFGIMNQTPEGVLLPVAQQQEITTGDAEILCNVEGSTVGRFSAEITRLYPMSDGTGRDMMLRITDENLLKKTGGIVQGMSGSPIIQDGKIVGAVTHVLVNQPDTGYGIFIENMLDAAG